MEYANLKGRVAAVIKENGNMEITGDLLQGVLLDIISTIGTGFQFVGVANPSTNPGTPDAKVFYLAFEPGTYINFGGAVLTSGIGVFSFDSAWHYASIDIPSRSDIETAFDGKMNKITADAEIALKADSINPVMPPMVAGSARGVLGRSAAARFLYRQTSSGSGAAWLRSIHGRTVSYNQLVRNGRTDEGITAALANGVFTISGTITTYYSNCVVVSGEMVIGHKYLLRRRLLANPNNLNFYVNLLNQSYTGTSTWDDIVITATGIYANAGISGATANTDFTGVKFSMEVVDLTQAGLDTLITTPAEFEAWQMEQFGHKGYLGYTPGTLVSVNPTGLLTTGRNVWDEEYEPGRFNTTTGADEPNDSTQRSKHLLRVAPNTAYYVNAYVGTGVSVWMLFYDANENLITDLSGIGRGQSGNAFNVINYEFTTPTNCAYVKFYLKNDSSVCINISDPAFNGQYVPYNGVTTPLDFSEHFPKGMNGLNGIYDEVGSDENGKFTDGGKRFGIVDLGDLTWIFYSGGSFLSTSLVGIIKPAPSTLIEAKIVCGHYHTTYWNNLADKIIAANNSGWIRVTDSSMGTDPDDFKTAMSGVYLIYELATPQHVTFTDPSDAVYPVTEGGTEQVQPVNGKVPTTISPDMTLQMPRILGKETPTMATLDNFLAAIGPKIGKTITKEWDPETRSYQFDIQ